MTQTPPPPPPPGQPYEPQRTYGYEPHAPQGQPPHGYQQPTPPGSLGGRPEGDERTMMLLAHLSGPLSMLVSVGWLPFLGPLLIWLSYKDRSAAVRTAAAGAFNFNVSLTIASVALWISVLLTLGVGLIWAVPGWIALFVVQLGCHIKGAMRAAEGRVYDYPFQLRILS